jgi:hypothetical protein
MPAEPNNQPKVESRVVSLRLDGDIAGRVERAAAEDQRSVGNALRLLIVRALPEYEREVLGAPAPTPEEVAP